MGNLKKMYDKQRAGGQGGQMPGIPGMMPQEGQMPGVPMPNAPAGNAYGYNARQMHPEGGLGQYVKTMAPQAEGLTQPMPQGTMGTPPGMDIGRKLGSSLSRMARNMVPAQTGMPGVARSQDIQGFNWRSGTLGRRGY
jgi:hypothetical protein